MSIVDPTKTKPITQPPPPTAPAAKEKNEKKSMRLDFVVDGPKPDYSKMVLTGPGVASKVFGATSPNIGKMTDAELGAAIGKMGAAIKTNVGKVNDDDFRLYGALVKEAASREARLLDAKKPVAGMTNEELFHHALAFDMAKASGMKLTPEQEARSTEIDNALYVRGKVDPDGEIKRLQHVRNEAKKEIAVHCSAAAAGAYGLATHVETPAILASGAAIYHAVHEKKYGAAALEGALFIAARFPGAHKFAEGASTALNTIQCADAAHEYLEAGKKIEEAEKWKKENPPGVVRDPGENSKKAADLKKEMAQ
jgi:hypothetical protein